MKNFNTPITVFCVLLLFDLTVLFIKHSVVLNLILCFILSFFNSHFFSAEYAVNNILYFRYLVGNFGFS